MPTANKMGKTTVEKMTGQAVSGDLYTYPESYFSLCDRLGLQKGIPYSKDWSASADFLELIVDHCLAEKPSVIAECSSGLTTLMLARSCQLNNQGELYSLENGKEYAINTRCALDRYGLGQIGTVLHAPLEKKPLNGMDYQWYAVDQLPEKPIDMLVIDGPSGFIRKHSRYPALPLLFDRLSDHSVVYLDDAARDDERDIVVFWLAEYPFIEHRFIETERGCSVLTINKENEY